MAIKKICEQCGKEFISTKNSRKYCGFECAWESRRVQTVLPCDYCGKMFSKKTCDVGKVNYCSTKCRSSVRKGNEYIIQKDYAIIVINSIKNGRIEVLIDIEDIEKCKKYTWCAHYAKSVDDYYIFAQNDSSENLYKGNSQKTLLHRLLTNCPEGLQVDQIRHNTVDNRKSNLKICTNFENAQNKKKKSFSGTRGVIWDKGNRKWKAYIRVKNDTVNLGRFVQLKEAIKIRKQAELKYFGLNP